MGLYLTDNIDLKQKYYYEATAISSSPSYSYVSRSKIFTINVISNPKYKNKNQSQN